MEYYVSPTGNDAWSGRLSAPNTEMTDGPFRTLAQAGTVLQPGDTCMLRAGIYRETLRPEVSGEPGKPITIRGYQDEVAILTGADVLTGWKSQEGDVYVAPMEWDLEDQNQLFAGAEMLIEARWPNNQGTLLQPTLAQAASGSPTTLTDPNLPGEEGAWIGASLWCCGGAKWICWTGQVNGFDATTRTLAFTAEGTDNAWYTPKAGSEYVLMGVRAALDAEGEWWYNRDQGRVWLLPPGSQDPETLGIEAKRRLHVLDLSGRAYIQVIGLHFRAGGILTDADSHDLLLEELHGEYVAHSYGRDISDGSGVLIRGTRNQVRNCEFAFSSGSVLSLRGSDHRLINCYLHDGNYGSLWSGTVSLAGRRQVVSHNTIRHSGRDLVSIHGLSESLIQYNDLSHAGWLTHDLGMTYGHNTDFANTVIHHNWVHDNQAQGLAMGIYFDHLSHNVIVHHNAIWNVTGDALRINNPSYFDLVYNNTCFNTNTLEWARQITTFDHSHRQDLFGVRWYNNLLNVPLALPPNADTTHNLDLTDPGYTNPAELRFDLKPDSPGIRASLPLPDVAVGTDGGSPDLGAFPSGKPLWKAGHDFAHPPQPEPVWKPAQVAWMNGVTNACFEWGTLEGWTPTDASTAQLTPGNGWGNNFGAGPPEETGTSNFELRLGGGVDGVEQLITGLYPETDYTLSAWVKVSGAEETVCLGVRRLGVADATVSSNSPRWTHLILPFRTAPGENQAVVFLRKTSPGPGYVWCDNVGLPRTPRSLPAQAVQEDPPQSASAKPLIAFYSLGDPAKEGEKRIIGLIYADGSGERYLNFGVPGQLHWQFQQPFADGRHLLVTSWQKEGPSRKWIYDLPTGQLLQEIVYSPGDRAGVQALLPGEKRIVVGTQPLIAVDLDGSNSVALTTPESGYMYGVSLSPDGHRLAFHETGGQWGDLKKPSPFSLGQYNINVLNLETHERILVAGAPGHLYFGPAWSPDGQWLAYLDCQPEQDPHHFRGDVCVGKSDGSEHRVLTEGQPHWFGAAWYGGGGSNMVSWSGDGTGVLFTRLLPHSNREQTQGGTQLCLVHMATREITPLTAEEEGLWVHHASWSRDGKHIVYTCSKVGQPSELWIMDCDGSHQRRLTQGDQQRGVDLGGQFLVSLSDFSTPFQGGQ